MNSAPKVEAPEVGILSDLPAAARSTVRRRVAFALAALALVVLVFFPLLRQWWRVSLAADLHSHAVLIPLVTLYLLVTDRHRLCWDSRRSPIAGAMFFVAAAGVVAWLWAVRPGLSEVDQAAVGAAGWLLAAWGVAFAFLGRRWVRSALFPLCFLVFMVPLPDVAAYQFERFLMSASAVASELVFRIGGIPVFREGQMLELPGVVLEVAQSCSGIRSTWALLITSVLAGHLLLPTRVRQWVFIAAVLPLGILRNAVRIFVIGWLCVEYGPEMIDHWVHRRGGPVFFAASLVPLFLLALLLRRFKTPQARG